MNVIERVDPSIIEGAYFSWVFRHNLKVGEQFIQHLVTDTSKDDNLLRFEWINGESSNLESLPLLYDVSVQNLNPRWRLQNAGINQHESVIVKSIREKLLYKKTLIDHLPDLEDLLLSIDLALSNHTIPSCFKTLMNSNYADAVVTSCLEPRSLVRHDIDNEVVKLIVRSEYQNGFIKGGRGRSLKPGEDPDDYYELFNLPLAIDEVTLYETIRSSFEALYIGFIQAIDLTFQVRLFDNSFVFVERMSRKLDQYPRSSVRIKRISNNDYYRFLYLESHALARHADNGITREIRIKLAGDSPEKRYTEICDGLSISLSTVTPLTTVIRNLDPIGIGNVAVAMAKVYTNPNLYQVMILNQFGEATFSLPSLFGIFVYQALFTSTVVSNETKMYFNNYIARFIVSYSLSDETRINLPRELKIGSCSYNGWFTEMDRLREVYRIYALMPTHVQHFLDAYFGVINPNIQVAAVLVGNNSLDLPFAGHRVRGDLVRLNLWEPGALDPYGRPLIRPTLPYTMEEIMNWSGAALSDVIISFSNLIKESTSPMRQMSSRFGEIMRDGTCRIQGLLYMLMERAYVVATTPFSDDQYAVDMTRYCKIDIPLDLVSMISVLVYPSIPTEGFPQFQPPSKEYDSALQTTIPLVTYIMDRMRRACGGYANVVSPRQLYTKTITALKGRVNLSAELFKELTDSVTMNRILAKLNTVQLSETSNISLHMIDAYYQWLANNRQRRGLRDHFYISIQPAFLNLTIERLSNVFYTNGIPNIDVVEFAMQAFDSNSLIRTLIEHDSVYVRGHDVNGSRSGIERIKNALGQPYNPFEHAVMAGQMRVVRVDHPCIVKYDFVRMTDRLVKPNLTRLVSNEDFMAKLQNNQPIEINIVIQTMDSDFAVLESESYNKVYSNDSLVLTADLFPMPSEFLSMREYFERHNNNISMRKDVVNIMDSDFGISTTGLLHPDM